MDEIVIAYSRHDNLKDNYSDRYKFEARNLIDNVTDEIMELKDTVIISLFAEMKEVKWMESGNIEPVYSLAINQKYLLQLKINELMKTNDVKRIAKRLNEIIVKKQIIK
jgi:ubiquinone biosynthesis protein Coq4